jgi:hypothetical protein
MTDFAFTELADMAEVQSGALGASSAGKFADIDRGKSVKKSTANNFILCVGGNEIEGFVTSVAPYTVNQGFSFGSVQVEGRKLAVVGANQGGTPMAVGDLVVSDTQAALGTGLTGTGTGVNAQSLGMPPVKTGTPATFKWRCIRIITGTGVAGDQILIESINS